MFGYLYPTNSRTITHFSPFLQRTILPRFPYLEFTKLINTEDSSLATGDILFFSLAIRTSKYAVGNHWRTPTAKAAKRGHQS